MGRLRSEVEEENAHRYEVTTLLPRRFEVARPNVSFAGAVVRNRRGAGGELFTDDGRDAGSQDFDRSQHLLMRERRDAHLERDARDAAEGFVHVQYFLRDSFGVADQERTGGSAHGVELCPGSWGPAAFLADLGERVRVSGIKVVGRLLGGVSQEADGVKTHDEFIGGVTGAAACLAVEIDQRAESFGFATDDGDHEGESEHTGASE